VVSDNISKQPPLLLTGYEAILGELAQRRHGALSDAFYQLALGHHFIILRILVQASSPFPPLVCRRAFAPSEAAPLVRYPLFPNPKRQTSTPIHLSRTPHSRAHAHDARDASYSLSHEAEGGGGARPTFALLLVVICLDGELHAAHHLDRVPMQVSRSLLSVTRLV
jgi:hypothetical protein